MLPLWKVASNMKPQSLVHRTRIAAPAEEVFAWHARPGAFERLTPPWASVTQLEHTGGIKNGARRVLVVQLGPLRRRWTLEHCDYVEGRQFADVQVEGPFRAWKHTHRMIPAGPDASILEDEVEYTLPAGPLGKFLSGWFLDDQLRRLFEYRHQVVAQDFAHAERNNTPSSHSTAPASGDSPESDSPNDNPASDPTSHERQMVVADSSRWLGSILLPTRHANALGLNDLSGDELLDEHRSARGGNLVAVCQAPITAIKLARQAAGCGILACLAVMLNAQRGSLGWLLFPLQRAAGGQIGSATRERPMSCYERRGVLNHANCPVQANSFRPSNALTLATNFN